MSSCKTRDIPNEGVGGIGDGGTAFIEGLGGIGDGGTEFIEGWGGGREGKSAI